MACRLRCHTPRPLATTACLSQVLEVSAGTGRNFGCYSSDVEHVVFSDVSFDMLRLAKLKWEASQHDYTASFMLSDVESLVWPPPLTSLLWHAALYTTHPYRMAMPQRTFAPSTFAFLPGFCVLQRFPVPSHCAIPSFDPLPYS